MGTKPFFLFLLAGHLWGVKKSISWVCEMTGLSNISLSSCKDQPEGLEETACHMGFPKLFLYLFTAAATMHKMLMGRVSTNCF